MVRHDNSGPGPGNHDPSSWETPQKRFLTPFHSELRLRIILDAPAFGVDFGPQNGNGLSYETIQKERSNGNDICFDCTVTVKDNREDGLPNFLGSLTQGPATSRFIYIDVGKLAGQPESCWERRIKIPLGDITWDMIKRASGDSNLVLEAHFPGTAKDGGPSCATVHPAQGWKFRSQRA